MFMVEWLRLDMISYDTQKRFSKFSLCLEIENWHFLYFILVLGCVGNDGKTASVDDRVNNYAYALFKKERSFLFVFEP